MFDKILLLLALSMILSAIFTYLALTQGTGRKIEITARDVKLKFDGGEIQGFLVAPGAMEEKVPAIILVSEGNKLTDWEKSCAVRFAKRGYMVLAVELHGTPGEKLKCIKSALEYIKSTGRINSTGIIGWFKGGEYALKALSEIEGFSSGITCCGQVDDELLLKINVPILGIFVKGDENIKNVKKLQNRLKSLGKQATIKIFPSVKPSFMNPESKSYDEILARNAWDRIDKFFRTTLCSQRL
jgi:dienelactone hydrolase